MRPGRRFLNAEPVIGQPEDAARPGAAGGSQATHRSADRPCDAGRSAGADHCVPAVAAIQSSITRSSRPSGSEPCVST